MSSEEVNKEGPYHLLVRPSASVSVSILSIILTYPPTLNLPDTYPAAYHALYVCLPTPFLTSLYLCMYLPLLASLIASHYCLPLLLSC